MLELGLVMPVYFSLIFGVLELSLVLYGYAGASYAAKAGVRYAIVHGTLSGHAVNSTTLSTYVSGLLFTAPSGGATITCSWSPDQHVGSTVTVQVTVVYPTMIPYSNLSTVTVGSVASGIIVY